MAVPPGGLSFQLSMYYCKSCQTTLHDYEQYAIYDAFGTRCYEGCLDCVLKLFANGWQLQSQAVKQHTKLAGATAARCPICDFREPVETFYGVTRADILQGPLLNCCGDCVLSELHALNNLIQAHSPSVNDTCQYCKKSYPTIAIVEIEPTCHPIGCEKFEGCWDCYVKALLDAKLNAKYANGYAPSPLSTQYATAPVRCEHCGIALVSLNGNNSTWDTKMGWLAEFCDGCLEKLVIQPINAQVHGASQAPAQSHIATTGKVGGLQTGQMQQIQQQLQSLFGPPSAPPTINTSKITGTWHVGDGDNKADAPADALLRLAARYVQVCLEGGDWDIIDSSIDVSRDLLMQIRQHFHLPETHDFTKREPKK